MVILWHKTGSSESKKAKGNLFKQEAYRYGLFHSCANYLTGSLLALPYSSATFKMREQSNSHNTDIIHNSVGMSHLMRPVHFSTEGNACQSGPK